MIDQTTDPPTARKRIADVLEDAHVSIAEIHRAVCREGGWISYPYVAKIVRGADDVGPKAAIVRAMTAQLTGKTISQLFSGTAR